MAKTRAEFLLAEGWYLSSRKKQGCMIIERWSKPGTDWQRVSQGTAYQVARDSKKWREAQKGSTQAHDRT